MKSTYMIGRFHEVIISQIDNCSANCNGYIIHEFGITFIKYLFMYLISQVLVISFMIKYILLLYEYES